MKFISLFAGIGGLDLGLERAGMTCVGQVEIDDYATNVLARHWPDVPRWRDVRDVGVHNLPACDLICGGFPCQDISNAGKRAGIDGERSGLWSEYARIVRELRPRYVLVENVAALLGRGIERVLGDLAACGYDAEWQCVSAASVGAPHLRERIFIVAYANGERQQQPQGTISKKWRRLGNSIAPSVSNDDSSGREQQRRIFTVSPQHLAAERGDRWAAEPDVVRMVHGVPNRVDRLRGLGNAVVPQVAEYAGRQIMSYEVAA